MCVQGNQGTLPHKRHQAAETDYSACCLTWAPTSTKIGFDSQTKTNELQLIYKTFRLRNVGYQSSTHSDGRSRLSDIAVRIVQGAWHQLPMTEVAGVEGLTMTFLAQFGSEPNRLTNWYQSLQLCLQTSFDLFLFNYLSTATTEHLVYFPNKWRWYLDIQIINWLHENRGCAQHRC